MVLDGLQPYTSYWLFLVPHYKGVLGVPSNLQAYTSPQDGEEDLGAGSRKCVGTK